MKQLKVPFKLKIFFVAVFCLAICVNGKSFRLPEFPKEQIGLYNNSDKVFVLTGSNFNQTVLQQNRSTFVEFYNSYCGHCKRFAPFYKQLAEQLYSWRDVIPICAIDCAAEENNDICREYEIMAYPTLRYMGPNFTPGEGKYGEPLQTQDLDEIRTVLAGLLSAENHTNDMISWPNLKNVTENEILKPFESLGSHRKLVFYVFEPDNTTIGIETILNFSRYPAVQIRRVTDAEIALKLKIDSTHRIVSIDRKGNTIQYTPTAKTAAAYAEVIQAALKTQHFTERPEILTTQKSIDYKLSDPNHDEILKEVKRNKHLIYQADLEMAIHNVLFNEIPKKSDISGESLLALQRFLAVLKRYNPLGPTGQLLVNKMQEFIVHFNEHISGKEFEDELKRWNAQLTPVFSSNHYVGCASSRPGLRGFTCSLWQLFHFMTVQAATSETSQDPLEVLQAMHGYIKYFFGCSECSEHFQNMATKRKIWDTPNKDEAVLWLWSAHNEVNQRLAGDNTEDPKFPKIQFPSPSSCEQCYKEPLKSPSHITWDKNAVLSFLKNIHNPEFVSRFGVENEDVLQPSVDKLRQKRMISNVFTDMDMRMGMLLYGFCIVMMVVAFKLFAYKGYRKKPYCHDMLGKV